MRAVALVVVLLFLGGCAVDPAEETPFRPPAQPLSDGGGPPLSDAGPVPCGGTCAAGYRCDVTLQRCVDFDECDAGRVGCGPAGLCVNTAGSWRCECDLDAFPDRRGACVRPSWHRLPDGPSPRRFPAMALDRARGKLVLYGGESWGAGGLSTLTDTWEWDGVRWQSFDAGGPGARAAAVMAWDEARSQMVLFGGAGVVGDPGHVDETWTWDGASWTQLSDAGPGKRMLHSMSFDPRRRQVLLFGGDPALPTADTWGWDGTRWSKLAVAPGTILKWQTQMLTDRRNGDVLLYTGAPIGGDGGVGTTLQPSVDDLWRLEGTAWKPVPNSRPGPSTVGVSCAAWSDDGFFALLDTLNHSPQTWVWDGTWHGLELVGPPQRMEAGAATAPDGGIVVCGGSRPFVSPSEPGGALGDCWWFGL